MAQGHLGSDRTPLLAKDSLFICVIRIRNSGPGLASVRIKSGLGCTKHTSATELLFHWNILKDENECKKSHNEQNIRILIKHKMTCEASTD